MALTDAIHQHLDQHGPCTVDEVYAAMREQGATKARSSASVYDALRRRETGAERLPDDRWDVVTRRLTGATLTVRPRSRLADGVLWAHADLTPFQAMRRAELPLRDGGSARWHSGGVPRLVFPPGALPATGQGQLLALTWDGASLTVSVVDEPVDDPTYAERTDLARRLLALHAARRDPWALAAREDLRDHVLSALREDPDLLRHPLPPLSELLPLPEVDVAPAPGGRRGQRLALVLADRVVEELDRRARLLGDTVPGYAAMLLTSAVDRVRPPEEALLRRCPCGDPHCRAAEEPDPYEDGWPDVEPEDVSWEPSSLALVRGYPGRTGG